MHVLSHTTHLQASDSWLLGVLSTHQQTGSECIDTALNILAGRPLPSTARSDDLPMVVEPWLMKRPLDGWQWMQLHSAEQVEYLGGWLEAGASKGSITLSHGPLALAQEGSLLRQLLEIEGLARRADQVDVPVRDLEAYALPADLPDPCSSAMLAAWSNAEPLIAVDHAVALSECQRWESIRDAVIYTCGRAAELTQGKTQVHDTVVKRLADGERVMESVVWLEVGVFTGVLSLADQHRYVKRLSAWVEKQLDLGERWKAGLPLLRCALVADCTQELIPYFERWCLGTEELAELIVRFDCRSEDAWQLLPYCEPPKPVIDDRIRPWQSVVLNNATDLFVTELIARLKSGAAGQLPCHPHFLWTSDWKQLQSKHR